MVPCTVVIVSVAPRDEANDTTLLGYGKFVALRNVTVTVAVVAPSFGMVFGAIETLE